MVAFALCSSLTSRTLSCYYWILERSLLCGGQEEQRHFVEPRAWQCRLDDFMLDLSEGYVDSATKAVLWDRRQGIKYHRTCHRKSPITPNILTSVATCIHLLLLLSLPLRQCSLPGKATTRYQLQLKVDSRLSASNSIL